jgi:hypothetical protein
MTLYRARNEDQHCATQSAVRTCWVVDAAGVSRAAGVGAAAGGQRSSSSVITRILVWAGVGVGGCGIVGVTCAAAAAAEPFDHAGNLLPYAAAI